MRNDLTYSNHIETAKKVRRTILEIIHTTQSPHIGSSFSIVEILVALYHEILDLSKGPDRDKFILSKGHACPALYATLFEHGFLTAQDLKGFAVDCGTLEQHPNMDQEKRIEVSTGSLGHGLSIGAGLALAAKVAKKDLGVFVLLSDGELNEGSVWEAALFAGHQKLKNLTALVDYNKMQALGFSKDILDLDPLGEKWESFGWHTQEVDGHDFGQILNAFGSRSSLRPNTIIFHTIKGKGVSFMENKLLWHYRAPDEEEYRLALKELTS
jgi:transketolase